MKNIIFFIFIVAFKYAFINCIQFECTENTENWCKNFRTAKSCNVNIRLIIVIIEDENL